MEENTESAKSAEAASKLSPEQSRMLRRVFKQFDEDGSHSMSFDEFYQACNAMGLFIDEAKAKSLFQRSVVDLFIIASTTYACIFGNTPTRLHTYAKTKRLCMCHN